MKNPNINQITTALKPTALLLRFQSAQQLREATTLRDFCALNKQVMLSEHEDMARVSAAAVQAHDRAVRECEEFAKIEESYRRALDRVRQAEKSAQQAANEATQRVQSFVESLFESGQIWKNPLTLAREELASLRCNLSRFHAKADDVKPAQQADCAADEPAPEAACNALALEIKAELPALQADSQPDSCGEIEPRPAALNATPAPESLPLAAFAIKSKRQLKRLARAQKHGQVRPGPTASNECADLKELFAEIFSTDNSSIPFATFMSTPKNR